MLDNIVQRWSREAERQTLLFWFYEFHLAEALSVVKQVSLSHSADFRKYCFNATVWNNHMPERPGLSVVIEAKSFLHVYKKW